MAAVEVRDNPEESRYEAYVDGRLAGFSVYDLAHGTINFIHTEVDDAYEGQGVGSDLVRQMLDQLRQRGDLRVTASCPFVRAWLRRHPDYQDLTHR
jgi:predicted GNAT family acetyltransferase